VVVNSNGVVASAAFQFLIASPTILTLSPPSATVGGVALTLTVNGTNYVSGATVNWGSIALTTTFVSTTQLTAAVPANLIVNAGTVSITVTTSAGTSAPASFTIGTLAITGLSMAKGPEQMGFVITGSGFGTQQGQVAFTLNNVASPLAIVKWDDGTHITVQIPAGTPHGVGQVSVILLDGKGNTVATSGQMPFETTGTFGCNF
jgi:hypothetical protein